MRPIWRIDVAFMDFIRVRYRYQEGESWHRDAVPIIQRARADSLKEAQIIIESWRRHYYAVRPHGSLGYRPPAPEVFVPGLARAWPSAQLAPTATLSLASNMPLN